MSDVYNGFTGALWQAEYIAAGSYSSYLASFGGTTSSNAVSGTVTSSSNASPTLAQIFAASTGMYSSFRNGAEAINAFALNNAWGVEIGLLQQIQSLPLTLDPTTLSFVNARISAYEAANAVVATLIPFPPYGTFSNAVINGNPLVPQAGLLKFFSNFSYETPPAGLTGATLVAEANAVATAFQTLSNAILALQGQNVNQLYDVALREFQCALSAANLLGSFVSGPFSNNVSGMNSWNQVVALPAMLMCSDIINGAAYNFSLQQNAVLRNAMLSMSDKIGALLLSLRQPLTSTINLTTLRTNETLLDVAARALGDFELWPEIAALNGLVPPYVGPVASPGIAAFGTSLILPTPGTSVSPLGNNPSYSINFLGTDLYVGPINSLMPPWAGDFQIISGLNNLRISLGRRLQTTQGTLMFHPSFGSRIPPEVGNVQTNLTARHINAYGTSALLSDPRVASVPATQTVIVSGGSGEVSFSADVQPSGFQSTPVSINEVISPIP